MKKMKKSVVNKNVRPRPEMIEIGERIENKNGYIGEMINLDIKDLEVAKYQKELNISRVEKIINKFDINRMRPIEVSYRDGRYWVFDGQHRASAYVIMGYTKIPAIVHYGLSYEDEAYLFARQQEEVGSVNSNHKWNALREAGDPETMDIIKLCKEFGFTVLESNNKGNNIKCVKSLRDFYKEFGPEKLRTILMCIRDAWNYMEHSVDVPILMGVARLIRTYSEFDYNRLTKVLSDTTPKLILRDMEDKHHAVRGESRRAAYQIADLYNYKLYKTHRLDTRLLDY